MKTVAQIISIVLHPFVTIVAMVIIRGWRHGSFSGTLAAVIAVGTIAILPVAVLILYKVLTGKWTTVDASRKLERPTLYAVSLSALLGLVLYLTMKEPDSVLVPGSLGAFGLLLCAWIVNRWVKTSLHMAFGSLVATVLIAGGAIAGWGMLALLPALAWSRLKLKRHTWGELAFGAILGTMTGLVIQLIAANFGSLRPSDFSRLSDFAG